jgi:signal transduction histidine kinase
MSQHLGKFLWLSDAQTKELIYVSPGYELVWHRTREASYVLPEDWLSATPPGCKNRGQGKSYRPMSSGDDKPEYQVAGPDGTLRWVRDRMFPIRDSSGNTLYTLGVSEDVTDLKQLEEAVRKSDLKSRALLSVVPDMVFRLRRDGVVLDFKPAKDSPLLTPSIKLEGRNIRELLPEQVARQAMHYLELTLSTGHIQTFTCQYLLPDYLRDFEARSVVCGVDEVLAVVRDVTERKRLEKEILEISSREQQRIGQDLHDGLGQHLTGITFLSKALERKLAARGIPEAGEAAEIGRLVIQALAQTRNLARGLFPLELETNGLVSALEEFAAHISKVYQITCEFESDQRSEITNNVLATHVFRVVQEAVNNSVKHGKARHIKVSLSTEADRTRLRIQDDGQGVTKGSRHEGLGLKIMQYRARRMGGTFDIQPGPGGGTVVTLSFNRTPRPAPAL